MGNTRQKQATGNAGDGSARRLLSWPAMAQVYSARNWRRWRFAALVLAGLGALPIRAGQADPAEPLTQAWCAPEFEELAGAVCTLRDNEPQRDTLVIFLHGVVKPEHGWQP